MSVFNRRKMSSMMLLSSRLQLGGISHFKDCKDCFEAPIDPHYRNTFFVAKSNIIIISFPEH